MTAEELEAILSEVPPDTSVEFHLKGRFLEIGDHYSTSRYSNDDPVMILEMN